MTRQPVALVTGATSGIGAAIANGLHGRGYLVYAVGRKPEALAALQSQGMQARSVDITDEAAVTRLVGEITAEHTAVDVLINCAGIPFRGPLEQASLDEVRFLFETHVVAPLHLSQAVLPGMRARRAGIIVNIGSTAGRYTSPGAGPYHITKYGIEAMSLALRAEVAQFGIRVTLIEPTGVRTPFTEAEVHSDYADDDPYGEFKRRFDESVESLARTPGVMIDADTVARAVLRAIDAKDPKPRYIVGMSGKATIAAQALLTDRMWQRIVTSRLTP